jgi:hypothetical protein
MLKVHVFNNKNESMEVWKTFPHWIELRYVVDV